MENSNEIFDAEVDWVNNADTDTLIAFLKYINCAYHYDHENACFFDYKANFLYELAASCLFDLIGEQRHDEIISSL